MAIDLKPGMSFADVHEEADKQRGGGGIDYRYDPANPYAVPEFSGDKKASKTRAWIARADWEDFIRRFSEPERLLREGITAPDVRAMTDQAVQDVLGSFSAAKSSAISRLKRYDPGANLGKSNRRALNLEAAGAAVDAKNAVRQSLDDIRRIGLMGGLGTVGPMTRGGE